MALLDRRKEPPASRKNYHPRLEMLEQRLAPATVVLASSIISYDASADTLVIKAAERASTIEVSSPANGAVLVNLGSSLHSSDPTSVDFDPALMHVHGA